MTKTLENTVVRLRALEPEDVDFIYNLENNPDNWRVSNTLTPFSKHLIKAHIESAHLDIFQTKQLRLIIESVHENKKVGVLDMFEYYVFHQRAGLGIIIAEKQYRQKGYAYNTLKVFIDYAFNTLNLNQLWCNIMANNKASINLFEKSGFKLSGVKKMWNKNGNNFDDELFYQKIRNF